MAPSPALQNDQAQDIGALASDTFQAALRMERVQTVKEADLMTVFFELFKRKGMHEQLVQRERKLSYYKPPHRT